MPRSLKPRRRFPWLSIIAALGLWFGYTHFIAQARPPQAILVLGGAPEREKFAAQFAQDHPDLPIWVSGGSPKGYAERVFSRAGISLERIHLDYEAVDTVTNFTTLVDKLKAQGIQSIYLITSDFHMRRARVIGQIILGSRGISFKPVPMPSQQPREPIEKALLDGARAVIWLVSGSTGSSLAQELKSGQFRWLAQPGSKPQQTAEPLALGLKHRAEQLKR